MNENSNRETRKQAQIGILKLKNAILKNSLEEFNIRLDQPE